MTHMHSTTLQRGDPAPDFSLIALNANGPLTLRTLTKNGPVILEFLRGTW